MIHSENKLLLFYVMQSFRCWITSHCVAFDSRSYTSGFVRDALEKAERMKHHERGEEISESGLDWEA